jgi:hypothetical protein
VHRKTRGLRQLRLSPVVAHEREDEGLRRRIVPRDGPYVVRHCHPNPNASQRGFSRHRPARQPAVADHGALRRGVGQCAACQVSHVLAGSELLDVKARRRTLDGHDQPLTLRLPRGGPDSNAGGFGSLDALRLGGNHQGGHEAECEDGT